MQTPRSYPAGVIVLAMLSFACQGSILPVEEPSTYVLREVEGDPLPTLLYTNEFVAVTVLSDTIRLNPDGSGTISGVTSSEPVQLLILPQPPTWVSADIRFRRVRNQLEIEYVCPSDADCAPPPHLIAIEGDRRLEVAPAPGMLGRSPRIYTAVD
jgi:hypothetical protein